MSISDQLVKRMIDLAGVAAIEVGFVVMDGEQSSPQFSNFTADLIVSRYVDRARVGYFGRHAPCGGGVEDIEEIGSVSGSHRVVTDLISGGGYRRRG